MFDLSYGATIVVASAEEVVPTNGLMDEDVDRRRKG